MSFLSKGQKQDLRLLAEEIGESPTAGMKIIDLKNLITKSKAYDEEFIKGMLETIMQTRIQETQSQEQKLALADAKKLELDAQTRQLEIEKRLELEAKKLEVDAQARQIEISTKLELEAQQKREQMEFELRKLEMEFSSRTSSPTLRHDNGSCRIELTKLMTRFNLREDDISLFLALFEGEAEKIKVDAKDWVLCLLKLLPAEIGQSGIGGKA